MDYLLDMEIAKSDLGTSANELMSGISALAAGAGFQIPQSDQVKVKARITGTFKDPKISTDLSENLRSTGESVKTTVEKKVTEEVEKVEEQVREEASEKADAAIEEAEAEAEHLIIEAKKAGDELVKEAEKQGEKLIKEAGSNPIKKLAATRAAEELKNQAKKQSDNLVKEAEDQAAKIIEKARTESEKI
jgi:regulator of protease activity HflC (stomatin/prohibitin superfamily)